MGSTEPSYTEDELKQIEQSVQNKNTAKRNRAAERKLRKHMEKWGYSQDVDLKTVEYEKFNEILRHLWFETRQQNGQKYRAM